jgi:hypothetical protein
MVLQVQERTESKAAPLYLNIISLPKSDHSVFRQLNSALMKS